MSSIRNKLRALPVFEVPLPTFEADRLPDEPLDLLTRWLDHSISASVSQPQVMTISTVDHDGWPHSRILTLKDVDRKFCYFTTSSTSAKGCQIATNSKVAMNFYGSSV